MRSERNVGEGATRVSRPFKRNSRPEKMRAAPMFAKTIPLSSATVVNLSPHFAAYAKREARLVISEGSQREILEILTAEFRTETKAR